MARSRKVWTPRVKPAGTQKPISKGSIPGPKAKIHSRRPDRKVWTPERESNPVPALPPNKKQKKTKRVLADVSKLKAARHDHGWRFEEYVKVHGRPRRGRAAVGARWTCDYQQADGEWGCKSFVWQHQPEPGQFHAWDCPYWHLEGKDFTPFD